MTNEERVPEAPTGWGHLKWLGPGFLWMVSAAGSGELLFSPRIGALYGYALVWALVGAVAFKWFINREIGRYAVCTGRPILEGFKRLPGPGNWALWVILVPQLVVAVATIAGLGSAAATAAIVVLPGSVELWSILLIVSAAALVVWGRYSAVESAATVIAIALALAGIVAALSVFDSPGDLARGFVPGVPADVDWAEVLPWIGFALSGAAGMMWYSYWLAARGYGAAGRKQQVDDPGELDEHERERLKGWLRQLTLDNTVAVVGTFVIMLAFLVLGAELLRPRGLVPAEQEMARTLGRMMRQVWGPFGFYFMIAGVLVGFWSTVLSDQDGFGRMFANGTRLLRNTLGLRGRWANEDFLQPAFVIVLLTILPIGLYLIRGNPVGLLQLAGAIEAAHIPFLAALTLYLNHRRLPRELRPSRIAFGFTALAGLFFLVFASLYAYQLLGGNIGGQPTTEDGAGRGDLRVQEVLAEPRAYLHMPLVLGGDVGEILSEHAFLLTGEGGELLVVRSDASARVPALEELLDGPVFEGESVRVAGYLSVLDLERFAGVPGWIFPVQLQPFEGELVFLAPVVEVQP